MRRGVELGPAEEDAGPVRRMRFRRAPLLFAAAWFAGGIALTRFSMPSTSLLACALLLLIGLSVAAIASGLRTAWLPVGAVWLVAGMAASELRPAGLASAALEPYADGLSRRVEGTVVRVRSLPAESRTAKADQDTVAPWEAAEIGPETDTSAEPLSVDLQVSRIERVTPDIAVMIPATGGVRVTVYPEREKGAMPVLRCGDRVETELRLRRPGRYRDPGAWQYADYLAEQGIGEQASATAAAVHVLPAAGRATLGCRLGEAQAWAAARLHGFAASAANRRLPRPLRLTETDAGMIGAMLFGDRTGLDRRLRAGFERTGSFHLFVVSGLHLALVAGAVFWAMRRLRAPRWASTAVTLLAGTGYAALTGFGQPVQRSLFMLAVYLVAQLLSRERESLNALGAAILAMLVWAPGSLFDAGLQMTVLAVVAIAGIAYPLTQRGLLGWLRAARQVFRPSGRGVLSPARAQLRLTLEMLGEDLAAASGRPGSRSLRRAPAQALRVAGWGLELLLIGAVTELVMILPMAVYFHRATVFALPANLLVIPLVALLASSAVLTFMASLVSPWAAMLPGAVTAGLLHGVTAAITRISRIGAADVRVPGPSAAIAIAAGVALLVCCWAVRRSGRWAVGAVMALPLIAATVLWPEPVRRMPGTLEVTAIDVGQGDSILAVSPEGQTMLIDAGGPIGRGGAAEAVSSFDVGEEVVSPYLWSRHLRRLDVMVLTHAHTDHMGGLPAVLENFRPRELWIGIEPASPLFRALLAQARALGIRVRPVQAGMMEGWSGVKVSVLAPEAGYANPGRPKNDDSVVLRMDLGRASALLEGDAERPSEQAMLAAGRVQPVTLLKVGHHGSNTSSTEDFLQAAQPEDAVLSAGRGNPFGHPRGEVVARFAGDGVRLFRTDTLGISTFLLTPNGQVREVVGETALPPHGRAAWLSHAPVRAEAARAPAGVPRPSSAGTRNFPAPFSIH